MSEYWNDGGFEYGSGEDEETITSMHQDVQEMRTACLMCVILCMLLTIVTLTFAVVV